MNYGSHQTHLEQFYNQQRHPALPQQRYNPYEFLDAEMFNHPSKDTNDYSTLKSDPLGDIMNIEFKCPAEQHEEDSDLDQANVETSMNDPPSDLQEEYSPQFVQHRPIPPMNAYQQQQSDSANRLTLQSSVGAD